MYSSHWSLCQQTEAEISNLTGDRAEEDRQESRALLPAGGNIGCIIQNGPKKCERSENLTNFRLAFPKKGFDQA